MELILFSVLYYLINKSVSYSDLLSVFSYMVINALGGILVLIGLLVEVILFDNLYRFNGCSLSLSLFFILLGLFIKLGIFPFYYQMFYLFMSLTTNQCYVIMFIPKVVPMIILFSLQIQEFFLIFVLSASVIMVLLSSLSGVLYTDIRAILAYSSISYLGFYFFLLMSGLGIFVLYFLLYYILLSALLSNFNFFKFNIIVNMSHFQYSFSTKVSVFFILLVLSGQPVFFLFLLKLIMLYNISVSIFFYIIIFFLCYFGNIVFYVRLVLLLSNVQYPFNLMSSAGTIPINRSVFFLSVVILLFFYLV